MTFRILNFCGGGIRGLMSATLLSRLDTAFRAESGKGLIEQADMIAGTSTGAVITGLLLVGLTPDLIIAYYRDVMLPKMAHANTNPDAPALQDNLLPLLDKFRLDPPISDWTNIKKVLFTAFELGAQDVPWTPQLINNFPGSPTGGVRLLDAMCGSGAMPGIMAPALADLNGRQLRLVDGGFVHHDPTVPAIALAVGNGNDLASITAIDIGTGFMRNFVSADVQSWGSTQWLHGDGASDGALPTLLVNTPNTPANQAPVFNLSLNGTSTNLMPDLAGMLLGDRFAYLNPDFGSRYVPEDASDPADIDFLVEEANTFPLDAAMDVLRKYWMD